MKQTINISGMHCSSCAATIEKLLKKTAGITGVRVRFMTQTAVVEFDETKIQLEKIKKLIKSAGYEAVK